MNPIDKLRAVLDACGPAVHPDNCVAVCYWTHQATWGDLRSILAEHDRLTADEETRWDQHSVQCGCCSVEILTRGGSIADNNGLSTSEGEEEHLCGRCAGAELDRLTTKAAQAKLIGAAEELTRMVYAAEETDSCHNIQPQVRAGLQPFRHTQFSQRSLLERAIELRERATGTHEDAERLRTELRERAAKEAGGG